VAADEAEQTPGCTGLIANLGELLLRVWHTAHDLGVAYGDEQRRETLGHGGGDDEEITGQIEIHDARLIAERHCRAQDKAVRILLSERPAGRAGGHDGGARRSRNGRNRGRRAAGDLVPRRRLRALGQSEREAQRECSRRPRETS